MATTLPPNRLQAAGHFRAFYDVVLPGEVTIEAALKPEYWAHVGAKLKQHDSITIFPEDGSRFVEVIVLNAGRGFANVKVIREVELGAVEQEADVAGFSVQWKGPAIKFCVIRESDGEKLHTGASDKESARLWLSDYVKTLSR